MKSIIQKKQSVYTITDTIKQIKQDVLIVPEGDNCIDVCSLLDSIYKNYPIGVFCFERTQDKYFVIDGAKRLRAIFGAFHSPIFFNLETQEFIICRSNLSTIPLHYFPVSVMLKTVSFIQHTQKMLDNILDKEKVKMYIEQAEQLVAAFKNYKLDVLELQGASPKQLKEIKQRLNTKINVS